MSLTHGAFRSMWKDNRCVKRSPLYFFIHLPFPVCSYKGPPGPPGPPGRPGMFNCPKGVSTSTRSLHSISITTCAYVLCVCVCVCSLSSLLHFLKTVFPIPPRPHCKMVVSFCLWNRVIRCINEVLYCSMLKWFIVGFIVDMELPVKSVIINFYNL